MGSRSGSGMTGPQCAGSAAKMCGAPWIRATGSTIVIGAGSRTMVLALLGVRDLAVLATYPKFGLAFPLPIAHFSIFLRHTRGMARAIAHFPRTSGPEMVLNFCCAARRQVFESGRQK